MTRRVTLKEVSERIDYGITTSAVRGGQGPKFLRITDIDKSFVDWTLVPNCEISQNEEAKYQLSTGDLVIARTGASTGRSQWVEVTTPAVFASYLVRFRTKADFNSRFIGYILTSSAWNEYVAGVAHGKSAQPNMSASEMARFEFECPPKHEQNQIAEVLGALDDKIAANTNLATTAEELAQHIFNSASANLPRVSMSSVLNPILGGTPSRSNLDYWHGSELWISVRDITSAGQPVIIDTDEKITRSAVDSTKAKPIPRGSVILTARGTVGEVARLAEPASFNQSCYGFVPESLPPGILYFTILGATEQAKSHSHGSVFDTITMSTFDHLEIPAFDEATANNVEQSIAHLLDVVENVVRENVVLTATRDALLPALMSGTLRVRDAERVVESVL